MPKLTEARKELRRDQIIRAAARCFGRAGMERTSVADITAESGLSAGSIYAHFTSKAEIVRAVIHDVLDRRTALVTAYAAGAHPPSPAEVIVHLVAALDPDEARVALQAWGEATTDPAIRDIVVATIDRMHDLFRVSSEAWLVKVRGTGPADASRQATRLAAQLLAVYQAVLIRGALLDVDQAAVTDLVEAMTKETP